MNKTNNWKEIEEEFEKAYQNFRIDCGSIERKDREAILQFFKPYFQEKMHEEAVEELEIVDNNLEE